MRRLLAVFLLVLLPLQFTWAAAAIYCAHEREVETSHVGHHEHRHDASDSSVDSAEPAADTASTDASASDGQHADCGVCHLSGAQKSIMRGIRVPADTAGQVAQMDVSHAYTSHPRERIERPNWQRA